MRALLLTSPAFALAWAAGWIFLFGLLVVSRHLPLRWAAPLVALKAAIPFLYFYNAADGALQLKDDQYYFHLTVDLLRMGYNPLSILTDPLGIPVLLQMTGSRQVVYNLWNLLSMWLFGAHYFAPVFLNVGLTFVSGWFFFRILRDLGFPRFYCRAALAFFLLHWDIVIWSSFLNLKDILVLTLTMAFLHFGLLMLRRPSVLPVLGTLAPFALLLFLRFYIPFILVGALLAALIWEARSLRKTAVVLGAVACLGIAAAWWMGSRVSPARFVQPLEIFWGVPHFLLTPLPWNLGSGYRFLYVPAWIWLALAGPSLGVVPFLWKRHPHAKLLFLYLGLIVLLYAVVPELRGPRHRVQVSFLFIWMQFHVLWVLARSASEASEDSGPGPSSGIARPPGS